MGFAERWIWVSALAEFPAQSSRCQSQMSVVMPKSGIKVVSETPGTGAEIKKGDRVRVTYDVQLNRGDYLAQDQETTFTVGDRELVAGFRYGIEGMRVGGARRFRASPHLCYRAQELERIPKNALLVFDIKNVELLA